MKIWIAHIFVSDKHYDFDINAETKEKAENIAYQMALQEICKNDCNKFDRQDFEIYVTLANGYDKTKKS